MRKPLCFYSLALALASFTLVSYVAWLPAKDAPVLDERASYQAWNDACQSMLQRRVGLSFPLQEDLPLSRPEPLYRLVDRVVSQGKALTPWVGRNTPSNPKIAFRPFAQKLSLPPGSRVIVHGDLHGDIRSLLASLNELQRRKILTGFKVSAPNTHLLFLGDYTDKGNCGVEVLYTLLRLRLENPRHVWLARGNHEDSYMTSRQGFYEECVKKYGEDFADVRVTEVFEALPSVIYVGTNGNFLQSCHGGMEPGYDPRELLQSKGYLGYQRLGTLKRGQFRKTHQALFDEAIDPAHQAELEGALTDFLPTDPGTPRNLGFMWHDFTLYQKDHGLTIDSGYTSRLRFGEALTKEILTQHSTSAGRIRGVLRAHQHSSTLDSMMRRLIASRGLFRHWQENEIAPEDLPPPPLEAQAIRPVVDGGVYTFNVSPDSRYGIGCNYTFHTFGILTLAPKFEDWRIEVVNLEVTSPKPSASKR